jgi:predicted RecB family nuclease
MILDRKTHRFQLAATDLSSFLACRHRTGLEMGAALGKFQKPVYADPRLEALFRRGNEHEAAYVSRLEGEVVSLSDVKDRESAIAATLAAMRAGSEAIVQGALGNERWYGRPDVLIRVERASRGRGASALHAPWSYEVADTKLARQTKATTVMQLVLYCALLEEMQDVAPERFHVVTPDEALPYRLDDYEAYFRLISGQLDEKVRIVPGVATDELLAAAYYPEPVEHCDICPWTVQCGSRRRRDDHLSLVAGISQVHRGELAEHHVTTLTSLAQISVEPLPFRPKRGGKTSYVRLREQARVQLEARSKGPVFELLPIVIPADDEPAQGLCRLPEPSLGDVFLDLEGDPFAGPTAGSPVLRGHEYLFGVLTCGTEGELHYRPFWAKTPESERLAFEAVMDLIMRLKASHPGMHVYHYAPYEPSAFKRLTGRHATREREMDTLLRSETFVDLYAVVRQALRAGVERYSLKNMEAFYGFERDVNLQDARRNLMALEIALEKSCVDSLEPGVLEAVEGYNRDDCISTLRLRDWLEQLRAQRDQPLPRPQLQTGEGSEKITERDQKIAALRERLLAVEGRDRHLLAYLLDFHRRESKVGWWEYYRLLDLTDEDLRDEPGAVSGLTFVQDLGAEKRSRVHRYRYPQQEMELLSGDNLKLQDESRWAEVKAVDRMACTIDVVVGPSKAHRRPSAAFRHEHIDTTVIENAIFAIAEGVTSGAPDRLAMKLLARSTPSTRNVVELHEEVLPIQGPPGAGKTYSGGNMICDLVCAGKKVGVAANSHKVIRNLLHAASKEARQRGIKIVLAHKGERDESIADEWDVVGVGDNARAREMLASGTVDVMGGTAWLWSRPEFAKNVDVLFIDEAGQVSLANALAMTQAASSLVLLGDPQQLDQPKKGTHPDGVEVSVLEHILKGARTMPEMQGIFLAETWRFGGKLCAFTSRTFYEGKLHPTEQRQLDRQALAGGPLEGAGLFVREVRHEGNRHTSDEEVQAILDLVEALVRPASKWVDHQGVARQMTSDDILIVSPYNAQVSRLSEALWKGMHSDFAWRIGTVDRFQGQEAPVVIYSMATSRAEDAPRGMEFLYSLNRLNVATSRAKCAAVLIASPNLFTPECKTPRQIQLANALCRFRQMATRLEPGGVVRSSEKNLYELAD